MATACLQSSAQPETTTKSEAQVEQRTETLSASETRAPDATFEDVLIEYQDLNERLARVAAPLRLQNAKLCPHTRRDPGFSIHKWDDYPAPLRPMAEALLGVKPGGIYIRAVRPNTSAADARLEPGDEILAVNGNAINSDPLMGTYNLSLIHI